MATISVSQNVANAGRGSLAWHLTRIINQMAAYIINDGMLTSPDFKVASTNTSYQFGATFYTKFNGVQFTKTAEDDIALTANHGVSANRHGAILVQINAAGTASTKVVGTPQAYTTAAAALAALPAPDAGNIAVGVIQIVRAAVAFTGNTTPLTGAEGVTFGERAILTRPDDLTFRETGVPAWV